MWPFDQPPNCATVVSNSIIEKRKPILYVSHDEDDHGWQFLDNESEELDDLCIVGLGHILEVDPSMAGLASLEPGWQATRADINSEWVIERTPPEEDGDAPTLRVSVLPSLPGQLGSTELHFKCVPPGGSAEPLTREADTIIEKRIR